MVFRVEATTPNMANSLAFWLDLLGTRIQKYMHRVDAWVTRVSHITKMKVLWLPDICSSGVLWTKLAFQKHLLRQTQNLRPACILEKPRYPFTHERILMTIGCICLALMNYHLGGNI